MVISMLKTLDHLNEHIQGWASQGGWKRSICLLVGDKSRADGDKATSADGKDGVVACRSLLVDTADDPDWYPDPSWLQYLEHIKAGAIQVKLGKVDATHRAPYCRV